MSQKLRDDVHYFLVEGWYDQEAGIHDGIFYGAYCLPTHLYHPVRCVIEGADALVAGQRATEVGVKVLPSELVEEGKIEEMVSCGAVAARPAALGGVVSMQPPEISLLNSNRPKRRKKPKMPHSNKIGPRIPTISQSGGRLGGNEQ